MAVWLNVRLCLRKTNDLAGFLPLAALFEQFDPFEPLQDVTLGGDGTCAFKATMLRHRDPFSKSVGDLNSAAGFFNPSTPSFRSNLHLVTEHHVPAGSSHLVEDMELLGETTSPIRHAPLLDD
jgi:hypothetical protein